jgi:hypothetical protein
MLGIIAYTYCDFRAPESLKSSNILGAIISQYCLESGSVPDVLRAAYKSSQSPGYGASRPVSLLVDTITEILQHQKLYILIDGLDESTHAEEIGDLIQTIRSEDEHSNAKILVTGRPTEMLEKAFGSELQLRLTDHKKELSEDIDIYLKRQLELDKRLQWLHPETKQYILQTLTTDSNSMYIHRPFPFYRCAKLAQVSLGTMPAGRHLAIALREGYSTSASPAPGGSREHLPQDHIHHSPTCLGHHAKRLGMALLLV